MREGNSGTAPSVGQGKRAIPGNLWDGALLDTKKLSVYAFLKGNIHICRGLRYPRQTVDGLAQ